MDNIYLTVYCNLSLSQLILLKWSPWTSSESCPKARDMMLSLSSSASSPSMPSSFPAMSSTLWRRRLCNYSLTKLSPMLDFPNKSFLTGIQWRNLFWKEVCESMGSRRALTTAYHPQADGQTEVLNQTLEVAICAFINKDWDNWA